MKKYDNYKGSDIEWLGHIPEHWRVKRVKDISYTKSGTTPLSNNKLYYENGIHNWIRTTDLNNGELFKVEYKITDLAIDECRMKFLPIDTVLIAMYGGFGTIGKNAILKKKSTINQSVCSILPNSKKFDSKYLLYFFKFFRDDWRLFADGTRKDPNINQEAVRNLFLYQPPLIEQTKIAKYLDVKTNTIDRKTNLLQQKIKYYKAYRKTLINESVTKGLNKNVKRKDSLIDWIGEIPEHWQTERIKNIFKERLSKNLNLKNNEPITKNILSVMKDIGVINHRDKGNVGNKMAKDITKYKLVYPNDIVVNKMNIMIGSVGLSREFGALSVIYIVLTTKKGHNSKYYDYFFKSKNFQKSLRRIATGILEIREAVNMNLFKQEEFLVPPLNEQQEIANYLDAKTTTIDEIVKNLETQITTLKELRKTLINEVVTGKVKVSS